MRINHFQLFVPKHLFLKVATIILLIVYPLWPISAKKAMLDIRHIVSNAEWNNKELNKRMLAISNDEFIRHWKARNEYQMEYDFYAIGDYLLFQAFMPHYGATKSFLCYNPKTNKLSIAYREGCWGHSDTCTTYIATEEEIFPIDVCRTGFGYPFYNDTLIVAERSNRTKNNTTPKEKRAVADYILDKEYVAALKALERDYDSTCLSRLNVWDSIEKESFVEFREFIYSKQNSKVYIPLILNCIEISKKMFYDVESLNMGMWWPTCKLKFEDGHTSMEYAIRAYEQINMNHQYDSCIAKCCLDLAAYQMDYLELLNVNTRDCIKKNLSQAYEFYSASNDKKSFPILVKLGFEYQLEKNYEEAKRYYLEASNKAEDIFGRISCEKAQAINHLRDVYFLLGDDENGANMARLHVDIINGLDSTWCEYSITTGITDLDKYIFGLSVYSKKQAELEYEIYKHCLKDNVRNGKMSEIVKYYSSISEWKKVFALREELYNENDDDYFIQMRTDSLIKVSHLLADTQSEEKYLKKLVSIISNSKGEESEDYAIALIRLCDFYQRINDTTNASTCANKAIRIEFSSPEHAKIEEVLLGCGRYATWAGEYQNAEFCYNTIVDYYSKAYGSGYLNVDKARNLEPLVELYWKMGEARKAVDLYNEIWKLGEQPDGEYILNYQFMGDFAERFGADTLAMSFYYDGNLYDEVERVLYRRKDFKSAEFFIKKHFESIKSEITSNLIRERESARENVWNKNNSYITQVLPQYCYEAYLDSVDYSSLAYDVALHTKGYLLSTSKAIQNIILSSQDDNLIMKWRELLMLQDVMSQPLSSDSLAILQERARYIEQQILTTNTELLSSIQKQSLVWSDIKRNLKSNEVAIEYTAFFDQSINAKRYCAVLLRKSLKSPRYIPLFTEKELLSLLEQRPELNYDNSDGLFNLVWAKIIPYLKKRDIVYFAPDGELYSLNIELLSNSEGDNISHFCHSAIRLSSTRELIKRSNKSSYTSAILYGGVQYDMSNEELLAESELYSSTTLLASRGIENDTLDRGNVKYLPGTKKEVENINQMLKANNLSVQLFTTTSANEESFKALSGKHQNILHIATHGFYWSDSTAHKKDYFSQRMLMMDGKMSAQSTIDPLNRCGLLFAGANTALSGHSADLPEGVQDGILTAKEISLLDLRDADLVVLSACETGKGEITGEGVFGLQRAFKQAGAQTIIMSLWPVNDAATQLLMTEFYSNWITNHQSKREAFRNAQNTVRAKYEEPVYWAGFIMLD